MSVAKNHGPYDGHDFLSRHGDCKVLLIPMTVSKVLWDRDLLEEEGSNKRIDLLLTLSLTASIVRDKDDKKIGRMV